MLLSEPTRAWIYRVLTAAVPLTIAYGVTTEATAALWLALAQAVLGLGLAARNTSTKGPACVGCDDNAPHGENPELIDDLEVR